MPVSKEEKPSTPITNNDLVLNKYPESVLVSCIDTLSPVRILKTQRVSLDFIFRYILSNPKLADTVEGSYINDSDVVRYQRYTYDDLKKFRQENPEFYSDDDNKSQT